MRTLCASIISLLLNVINHFKFIDKEQKIIIILSIPVFYIVGTPNPWKFVWLFLFVFILLVTGSMSVPLTRQLLEGKSFIDVSHG